MEAVNSLGVCVYSRRGQLPFETAIIVKTQQQHNTSRDQNEFLATAADPNKQKKRGGI